MPRRKMEPVRLAEQLRLTSTMKGRARRAQAEARAAKAAALTEREREQEAEARARGRFRDCERQLRDVALTSGDRSMPYEWWEPDAIDRLAADKFAQKLRDEKLTVAVTEDSENLSDDYGRSAVIRFAIRW